jgi:hypothetical protein
MFSRQKTFSNLTFNPQDIQTFHHLLTTNTPHGKREDERVQLMNGFGFCTTINRIENMTDENTSQSI